MKRFLALLALAASNGALEAASTPVLNFDHANPVTGSAFPRGQVYDVSGSRGRTSGYTFRALEPVEITGLGIYDDNRDGIAGEYQVGLWGPQGLVASAVVEGGDSAELLGSWRHADVSDVVIPAGDYTIGFVPTQNVEWAAEHASCERGPAGLCELFGVPEQAPINEQYYWLLWELFTGDFGTIDDPRITLRVGEPTVGYSFLTSPVYSDTAGFNLPTSQLFVTAAFAGATVFVTPIPEPSTGFSVAFALGASGLATRTRQAVRGAWLRGASPSLR